MSWVSDLWEKLNNKPKSPNPPKPNPTNRAAELLVKLKANAGEQILFGQEGEPLVGVGQKRNEIGSDIYDMTGKYSAVYGFQLAGWELGQSKDIKDGLSFEQIKKAIPTIDKKGGLITFIWSINNPLYPDQSAKVTGLKHCITNIFASKQAMDTLNKWLDTLADFFLSLNGIPVIFRPFHECTGTWFWWSAGDNTSEEYTKLFRYTVDYLRGKGCNNILYSYNTGQFRTKEKFLSMYPGDDYVDILNFDVYDDMKNYEGKNYPNFKFMCDIACNEAYKRSKIAAVAECGFKGMPIADWWTKTLLPSIKGTEIAYTMVWLNANKKDFWGAWKGQESEKDFIIFAADNKIKLING